MKTRNILWAKMIKKCENPFKLEEIIYSWLMSVQKVFCVYLLYILYIYISGFIYFQESKNSLLPYFVKVFNALICKQTLSFIVLSFLYFLGKER